MTHALVMEELSRSYASAAHQCGLVELISTLLVRHGTEAQRRMLPDILGMRRKVAYCITAPETGTNVSGVRTTAVRDGDGWVLNGGKIWIHNAPVPISASSSPASTRRRATAACLSSSSTWMRRGWSGARGSTRWASGRARWAR